MIPECLDYFSLVVSKKLRCHNTKILVSGNRIGDSGRERLSTNCIPGYFKKYTFENMIRNDCHAENKFTPFTLPVVLIFCVLAYSSCYEIAPEKKVARSFYYWKSVWNLTGMEKQRIDSLGIKTIYLKFFDVDWDAVRGSSIPVAKLQVKDKVSLSTYHIIPTVFIANTAIRQMDSLQAILLAGKIYRLVKDICNANEINSPDEIQIDCDWTVSTRLKYFSLLQHIRQLSKSNISATIRLHQIKFLTTSGIPPVDRGMLMCYNMGNLKNPDTKNSIIETSELIKYVSSLSTYPLPLDIALPLFEWKVLFRNKTYKGLLENIPANAFANSFARVSGEQVEILKDTLLAGYELKKGDLLRTEESKITEVSATATEINKRLKNKQPVIALYHLDSVTLSKFNTNELESIFSIFR